MTLGRGAIFMKYFASVVSLFNISTEKFNLESNNVSNIKSAESCRGGGKSGYEEYL